MVEKAFLPVRFVNSKLKQSLANDVPQPLNPSGQGDAIRSKGGKEMNVIGHYDITTNSDIMLLRIGGKHAKHLMNFIAGQQALALICVEGDKVERPNITKQTTEPRRAPRPWLGIRARHGRPFTDCSGLKSIALTTARFHSADGISVYLGNASTQRGGYMSSSCFGYCLARRYRRGYKR